MSDGTVQDAVIRILTRENRRLLALIHHCEPCSVNDLGKLAGKAQPNVSRTLAAMEKVGLVRMVGGRPKRPELICNHIVIDLTHLTDLANNEQA